MEKHLTQCPRCFAKFRVSESRIGKRYPCPKCKGTFELRSLSRLEIQRKPKPVESESAPKDNGGIEQPAAVKQREMPPVPQHQPDFARDSAVISNEEVESALKDAEPPAGFEDRIEFDSGIESKSPLFKILIAGTALIAVVGVSYFGWSMASSDVPTNPPQNSAQLAQVDKKELLQTEPESPEPFQKNSPAKQNTELEKPSGTSVSVDDSKGEQPAASESNRIPVLNQQVTPATPADQQPATPPKKWKQRTPEEDLEYAKSVREAERQQFDEFNQQQQQQVALDMQRIQGVWQAVQPGWVNTMSIDAGGTIRFNPGTSAQSRGFCRLEEDQLISIESETNRKLNFYGRYKFGRNTLTLTASGSGKSVVFSRIGGRTDPAMAGNTNRGPRFPIPGSGQRPPTSPSNTNTAQTNRPPAVKVDYGPLLEGNAYLLVGEWEFSRISKPNPALPMRMTLLHTGQALFNKDRGYSKEGVVPLVGTYRLISNNKLEFTAPFIKGGTSEVEFVFDKFDGRDLTFHDPKSGELLGTYTRTGSSLKRGLVNDHPDFKFKKWKGNGRVTLMQAIKHHLVEITVRRPYDGLARNQLSVGIQPTTYFYPSRVELVVEPGMPISVESAEMLVASGIQTDSKGKETNSRGELLSTDNVLIYGGENSFYGQYCRLTLYSFSSRDNVMTKIGYKQGSKRTLRFIENDEKWRMPLARQLFDAHDTDRYDPATELAVNILGAIWVDKSAYLSLNPRYSNLPSSKPGWAQAVHRVKTLLNFTTDETENDPLIGLWTSEISEAEPLTDEDKAARANASEISVRLYDLHKQGEKSFGQRSKLILQNEGRFLLVDPPVKAPRKRRYEGTWNKTGSTITLTPEYTPEELADKRFGDDYLKNNVYKLKISGDKLEYVGLKSKQAIRGKQHITPLKRHVWMTGPSPTPEQLARVPQKRTQVAQPKMSEPSADGKPVATKKKKRSKSNSALNPPQDWGKLIRAKKVTFTPIALSGQLAPGAAEGALFQTFTDPVINSQGQVAFTATIVGDNTTSVSNTQLPYGQFLATEGKLAGFGIHGHAHSRNTRSQKFEYVERVEPAIHLDDQGSVYFICNHGVSKENFTDLKNVLIRYKDGELTHCVYDGMPVNGVPDTRCTYGHKMTFGVNTSGQLLVNTRFSRNVGPKKGMMDPRFFVFGKPDNLQVLFREDTPTPDGKDQWAFFNGYAGALSGGENHVVFAAGLRIPDKKRDYVFSAWQGSPTELTRIIDAKMKLQLSKTSEGIKRAWIVGTNARGDVLMRVDIDKSTFNRASKALVLYSQGEIKVLVDPTQPIPNVKPKAYFWPSDDTVVNANGDVAATLNAFTDNLRDLAVSSDIWLWKDGKPKRILADPRQYKKNDRFRRKFSMNANCQILFNDSSRGGGRGLCLADENGKAQVLIPLHGTMELTPGDRRRVKEYSEVLSTGGNDSRRRQLNDNGQVAVRIQFDDDTEGIFLIEVKK